MRNCLPAVVRAAVAVACLSVILPTSMQPVQAVELAADSLRSPQEIQGLLKSGKYTEAEAAARELEAATPADSARAKVAALDLLVQSLWQGGKAGKEETLELAKRAVQDKEKFFDVDHIEVANSLNNLGCVCVLRGDYPGAAAAFERMVRIREKALGPDHADVAAALENLGVVRMQSGDYAAAKPLYERALAIKEKTQGPESRAVATSLNNMSNLLWALGELEDARRMQERSLELRIKILGPDHPDVATGEQNLAGIANSAGRYADGVVHARRAVAINERSLGPDHPQLAGSLNNLGTALDDLGEYAEARSVYERALAIQEKAYGAEHEYRAETLTNLANVCIQMGDYASAAEIYERAIAMAEKVLGSEHPRVAEYLCNLASLYGNTGDRARAVELFERAQAIQEKSLGPEHALVGATLNEMAIVLGEEGDYAASKPLFERALRIRENELGPESPSVGQTLFNYGTMLFQAGDLTAARPLLERSVAVRETALGRQHPEVARSRAQLADLLLATGEEGRALAEALESENIARSHLSLNLRTLPERPALLYAATRVKGLDVALSLSARGLDAENCARVWDAVVRSRALVLDELASRHHAKAPSDSETARLSETFRSSSQRLATLAVRGPRDDPPERYRSLLEEATRECEQAEKALAGRSLEFRREQAKSQIGFEDVAAALPVRGALVGYALYDRRTFGEHDPSHSTQPADSRAPTIVPSYLAFVLRAGDRTPSVFDLGRAEEMDVLVSSWRKAASRPPSAGKSSIDAAEAQCTNAGEELRRKIWDPLASKLVDLDRVFIVPDGDLHLVHLAALPGSPGRFLVEEGPLLHQLSTERDLVRSRTGTTNAARLLAMGGADFDATTSALQAAASRWMKATDPNQLALGSIGERSETSGESQPEEAVHFRGEHTACRDFASVHFEPLPASAREAGDIAKLWKRSLNERPKSESAESDALELTGASASETAFKACAPGQRVLHLATHGFFVGGECESVLRSGRGIGGLKEAEAPVTPAELGENPLLLSGLAFAGANHRGTSGAGEDDGVLTAQEIAAMDLSEVEWAVLSACDTGVGAIQAGEGVLGLRRAFEVAGAGTLIMSLWSVDDESARQWMRALYEARLAKGLATAEAVRAASTQVLTERRREHRSTHPFYWGGFVAAGDWR